MENKSINTERSVINEAGSGMSNPDKKGMESTAISILKVRTVVESEGYESEASQDIIMRYVDSVEDAANQMANSGPDGASSNIAMLWARVQIAKMYYALYASMPEPIKDGFVESLEEDYNAAVQDPATSAQASEILIIINSINRD